MRAADRTRAAAGAEAAVSGLLGPRVVVTATAVGGNALLLRVVFQRLSSRSLEGVVAWQPGSHLGNEYTSGVRSLPYPLCRRHFPLPSFHLFRGFACGKPRFSGTEWFSVGFLGFLFCLLSLTRFCRGLFLEPLVMGIAPKWRSQDCGSRS